MAGTYTYRGGEKINLNKAADEFVVRALPQSLVGRGLKKLRQVSSASTKVLIEPSELEEKMEESRALAPTHHAYYEEGSGQEFLITDRIMVTFRNPITNEALDAFRAKYGLVLLERYTDQDFLFQVTRYTGINPIKLVVKLNEEESELVLSAENDLNQRMKKKALSLPTDPVYARQWHLHTRYVNAQYNSRSCTNCENAWLALDHFGSPEIVVCVTDDGCRLDHPDFNSPGKFAAWGYMREERLVTNADIDANPSEMYIAGANHGTSCAGVIAGEADGVLTVGAAPGCRLLPIQWQSDDESLFISDSKLMTILNFIEDKVDIVSNSWGNVPRSLWTAPVINRIKQLANNGGRRGKGIIFLWAAGNENCPIQHTSDVKIPYTDGYEWVNSGWEWVGVKTAKVFSNNLVGLPGVMHVGALTSLGQKAHYSNYGKGVDIAAPSNNLHFYQRLTVKGLGISTTTGTSTRITHSFGGTSSATPLIAGIAALVLSANPDLTATEVISLLKQTATQDLDMSAYSRTPQAPYDNDTSWDISPVAPFNLPDFVNDGSTGNWSPWFGYGKADAEAAVKMALQMRGATPLAKLKIVSALVNPKDKDSGNEKLSIANGSSANTQLSDWTIRVNGRQQILSGQVKGGETLTIQLNPAKLQLPNKGGTIDLYNANGDLVDSVSYTKAQVKQGEVVMF